YVGVGTGGAGVVQAGWRSTIGSSVVITQRLAGIANQYHNHGATATDLGRSRTSEISYHAHAAWTPRSSLMLQASAYLQWDRERTTTSEFLETRAGTSQAQRTEMVDGSAWLRSGDVRAVWTTSNRLTLDTGVRVAHSTLTGTAMATPWLLGTWSIDRAWSLRAGSALA